MAEADKLEVIFREYDLRGTAKEGLDERFARRLGWAFAEYLRERFGHQGFRVSVGWDVRSNSPALAEHLSQGLTESGVDVLSLGTCPTPLLYFSLFVHPLAGGIMVTGSHNPPEYNGFKICAGKETISGDEIERLKQTFLSCEKPVENISGKIDRVDIIEKYLDRLSQEFAYLLEGSRLKVAVDGGNGTAGLVVPRLLERLGCEVIQLFCEPDGAFPNHHPDPTVLSNLTALQEVVLKEGCELGLAFDGDADRLGVVDEQGEVVYGDKLMILFSKQVLSKNPKAKIIGEVKCSRVMYEAIEKMGGDPIMWKTGHSLIKKKMKEEKAHLAGEMSGHFFFADRYFGFDDAVYASCRLIEILKEEKRRGRQRFSRLLEGLPALFSTPEIRVECSEIAKRPIVEKIKEKLINHEKNKALPSIREMSLIDGVRIEFDDGWGLIRASNTQAVLVLRFEASSKEYIESYQGFIEDLIEETKKEIKSV